MAELILVHGAACSGKSYYVNQHRREGDIVIDADLLSRALGSTSEHDHPAHIKNLGVKLRDVAIREASRLQHTAWIISSAPNATQTVPHTRSVHLDPGQDVCLQRAANRPRWTRAAIADYYARLEIPEPPAIRTKVEW